MDTSIPSALTFGPFRLIPEKRLLMRANAPLRLGSRAREILFILVERAGELVKKRELLARVWPGVAVEEGTLRVHISALRKALGDGEYVQNVNRLGYRFVGRIERVVEGKSPVTAPVATAPAVNHIPTPLTSMIGRDDVIAEISERLQDKRLLSIVGAGGIGKTTVASAAMERLRGQYADGVRFIDFSSATHPEDAAAMLATRLDSASVVDAVETLADKRMLLVLDNCEHVIDTVATLAETLLAGTTRVDIVATSREPLRVGSEAVLRLPPLSVPPASPSLSASEAMEYSAVQLFVEHARASRYTFGIDDSNASVVADICRRLDGLPLAIELAAAHVGLFGMHGLVTHLDDLLDLLTQGRRTAQPRQKTLRATLDWSFNLLSDVERIALGRLAVLPTSFDIEAARGVVVDERIGAADVLDLVTKLTAKSLIIADGADNRLFRLYETTRSYAKEQAARARLS